MEPRESCCKERIQAKRFSDPAQNQKRPARNREVFITQRVLALALLVALVLRRSESPGQQDASWDAHAFPPCSALQFDENCRLSGRLRAYFCTRGSQQACLNATPSRLEVSLRSLNLPPFLTRGFARRAFRLFAPARFLQGFFELRERTKGGICACSAKCCRETPQKHGDAVMKFHKRLGKRASRMHPTCRVLTRLVHVICQDRSLHFAS